MKSIIEKSRVQNDYFPKVLIIAFPKVSLMKKLQTKNLQQKNVTVCL